MTWQQLIWRVAYVLIVVWLLLWLLSWLGVGYTESLYVPTDCSSICQSNNDAQYCNSPYLRDGPAALCNCRWDAYRHLCVHMGDTAHVDGYQCPTN